MADYKDRFLNQLQDSLKDLHTKIDANTRTTNKVLLQATKTNGRVNDLEKDVSELRTKAPLLSNRTLTLAVVAIIISLIIVAGVLGVQLPKGLIQ